MPSHDFLIFSGWLNIYKFDAIRCELMMLLVSQCVKTVVHYLIAWRGKCFYMFMQLNLKILAENWLMSRHSQCQGPKVSKPR